MPVAPDFSGVCIALVEAVKPHPQASQLTICQVHDGQFYHELVCGAPNVVAGQKAAFARPGAQLPGGLTIQTREIRGQSSAGMLCSAAELGLGSAADGILVLPADAPQGEDLYDYLQLDDCSLLIELTPNRADCLSIEGLARELSALKGASLPARTVRAVPEIIPDTLPVQLKDAKACPRYLGRVIKNINLQATTPIWIQEKLRRCDINPIDPVVDVTNYVLRELGQPLHAFDLEKLQGGIQVRWAKAGEKLTLLNEKEVALKPDVLVIADDNRPVAMAGIMGGLDTGIHAQGDNSTRHIFLESAFFNPLAVAGRARDYGLITDAAQCFERGVDFELSAKAMERATALLLKIVGGEAGPVVQVVEEAHLPARDVITLRPERLNAMLGMDFEPDKIVPMFESLGFEKAGETKKPPGYSLKPPSWRFDMRYEADLIEEVARLYGYDNLPAYPPEFAARLTTTPVAVDVAQRRAPCDRLVALGYQEVINVAFSSVLDCRFSPRAEPVCLQNPVIENRPLMRTSLLPALVATMIYNSNRQQKPFKLFETGMVFEQDKNADNGILQTKKIAGLMPEDRPESWHTESALDFYDLKGDLAILLGAKAVSWQSLDHPAFHPGQSATISMADKQLGVMGALHPQLQQTLGVKKPLYLFELDFDLLVADSAPPATLHRISQYPAIRRDLAVVVDKAVAADEVLQSARKAAGPLLVDIRLFDLYEGDSLPAGSKSLAFGFTFQSLDKSLLESELDEVIAEVVRRLTLDFKATLRNQGTKG